MYTNIPAVPCLQSIADYLHKNFAKFIHVDHQALIDALGIFMNNNFFKFGDMYWLQQNGAAMGTPLCPPWATMYFASYKDDSADVFSDHVPLLKRYYIDDLFWNLA